MKRAILLIGISFIGAALVAQVPGILVKNEYGRVYVRENLTNKTITVLDSFSNASSPSLVHKDDVAVYTIVSHDTIEYQVPVWDPLVGKVIDHLDTLARIPVNSYKFMAITIDSVMCPVYQTRTPIVLQGTVYYVVDECKNAELITTDTVAATPKNEKRLYENGTDSLNGMYVTSYKGDIILTKNGLTQTIAKAKRYRDKFYWAWGYYQPQFIANGELLCYYGSSGRYGNDLFIYSIAEGIVVDSVMGKDLPGFLKQPDHTGKYILVGWEMYNYTNYLVLDMDTKLLKDGFAAQEAIWCTKP